MIIDCGSCTVRGLACDDCVVTSLLGPAEGLGSAERAALAVLADGGLVPPLRMRPTGSGGCEPASGEAAAAPRKRRGERPPGRTAPVSA
jgi:hypothetical protein